MDGNLVGTIITVLIAVIVPAIIFVLTRDLILWYFKINEQVANQRRIIQLLERIAQNSDGDSEITPTSAAPFAQPHNQSRR